MNELYMNINDYYRIIQQLLVNIYGHPGASVGKGKAPGVHGLVCKQDPIVRHHAMNECISRACRQRSSHPGEERISWHGSKRREAPERLHSLAW